MRFKVLRSDWIGLLILTLFSLGAGLLINQLREKPLPLVYQTKAERMEESVQHIRSGEAGATPVKSQITSMTLVEFSLYVEAKRGLILDARPRLFYLSGHVPGALSLPREDFERSYEVLREKLETNRSQPIVIYCSDSECEDSKLVRDSLKKLGCTNLSLFELGWSAWTAAGKPEESSR